MPKVENQINFYKNELSFKTRDWLQSIALYDKRYFQINNARPKYTKHKSRK